MKHHILIFSLGTILSLSACKKDKESSDSQETHQSAAEYLPLSKGSYWIYEQFTKDTNGVITPLGIKDSVYVKGDTVMDGVTWTMLYDLDTYYLQGGLMYYRFDGDKAFYIYPYEPENINFSATNFSSLLDSVAYLIGSSNDTAYTIRYYMTGKDSIVTVKAGTFKTITRRRAYKNVKWDCASIAWFPYHDKCYVKGLGVIYETMTANCSIPILRYRELVRYHLE